MIKIYKSLVLVWVNSANTEKVNFYYNRLVVIIQSTFLALINVLHDSSNVANVLPLEKGL